MEKFIQFAQQEWILFVAFFVILGLLLRTWIAPRLSGVKELSIQEAMKVLNQDDALLIDVRLEKEFKSGHILNAVHIPLGALDARAREVEKHKDSPVIVSCQSGNRSMHGARVLRKHGFSEVYNLRGGLSAWINANLPVSKSDGKKESKKRK
ncbi:MAG: rhodanese-like domain-containing protein [Gammaproteobacteria bacterium]|nr:rhodanese-like domain-containing protein [Gammaproteobacteria bacterium]MDH5728871.1 rhodanese-like domain-containing protein [Gammaproteobacteria bacterium]